MSKQTHIIYIPGLGDGADRWRLRALRLWRVWGVSTELVPMKWRAGGTFEQRLSLIDRAIDRAAGKRIVLIGESAGGSIVMHMMARRDDVDRHLTICGKNTHPETVGEDYYQKNPVFRVSMEQLNDSLALISEDKRKTFTSIHPLYDPIVPIRDTVLPGSGRLWLPIVGHIFAIGCAVTVFAPIIVAKAKK